jgi:hypothetical protein
MKSKMPRYVYTICPFAVFLYANCCTLYGQNGPAKATVYLDWYSIYKENNGWFSHGVNLYFGWVIVDAAGARSGGASQTSHHLQEDNGQPLDPANKNSPHRLHPAEEKLFAIEIPEGKAIGLVIQMVAENDTTAEVKAAFRRGSLVNLGNGPPDINFQVSGGNSTAAEQSAIASFASVIMNIFARKGSDHDYGHWCLTMFNKGQELAPKVPKKGNFCSGDCQPSIPIDGQRHSLMVIRYDDGENNIYAGFDILVQR